VSDVFQNIVPLSNQRVCPPPVPRRRGFTLAGRRVGNFRQKNNSTEDGIDGTNGYFRRNSGCSAEQKLSELRSEPFRGRENSSEFRSVEQKYKQTLRISFRTLQRKRKQLRIPFRGTKLEASSRNFLPNFSAEEKTTRNSVPWNKKRSKLSELCSEPFRGREK
jgi:hypothetical protein